jgi:uncharacterized membrane protein
MDELHKRSPKNNTRLDTFIIIGIVLKSSMRVFSATVCCMLKISGSQSSGYIQVYEPRSEILNVAFRIGHFDALSQLESVCTEH